MAGLGSTLYHCATALEPTLALLIACAVGFSTALFLAIPLLFRHAPPQSIKIPHRDYWLAPEHRAAATAKFARWSDIQGTAVNLLMIALQFVSSRAIPGVVFGFGAFSIGSWVWLALAYRLPAHDSE